jgi:hypothetical protein
MPAIDFTEIPQANAAGGQQDTFELFARDFLEDYGFLIEQTPGRGSDGGRDLLVIERRSGVAAETLFRWLVSCKHYAHSGKAVGVDDELNIGDRVTAAKADGFLGFYSTLPSAGLITRLNELNAQFAHTIFDRSKIEAEILKTSHASVLLKRFFPKSHAKWIGESLSKPELLIKHRTLACKHCGKDLLDPTLTKMAMVAWWQATEADASGKKSVKNFYWCCKGACDYALKAQFKNSSHIDLWEELHSFTIPTLYIRSITSFISYINDGHVLDEAAINNLMEFVTVTFHSVSRGLTDEERAIVELHKEVGMA